MTPQFLTNPVIEDISEGFDTQKLKLQGPLVWRSAVLGGVFIVPAGFEFEESIPGGLLGVVRQYGYTKRGAAAHDWGYRHAEYNRADWADLGLWVATGETLPVTRKQADAVYLELALLKGLPQWRALMRYRVLRLVGWRAWNAHRKAAK